MTLNSLTLSQTTSLDSPKLKEVAGENFKLDENGGNFCKRMENTVGKGEIASYKQFLLFPKSYSQTLLNAEAETMEC